MADSQSITDELTKAGWVVSDDGRSISKEYRFENFRDAIAWMSRVAYEAERINHHPEWSNVYNRVRVRLTTHDTGDLTDRDIELATCMERATIAPRSS